ncbi:hypothetical protein D1AOALGA4SA_7894 [Olavius algarvensis Delta 1 endosymbiont]|nr:hypothetical protein D1AOALGA4SA_7894 [Olavius algarvensis Delta 1 endosymbiont]
METFFGVALILAGSIWFLWSLYSLWKGGKSEDWNTTTGIITKSKVYEPYRKGEPSAPTVHYEYSIRGKTYKSDRIFWGNVHVSGTQDAAQEVVDKYKKGKKVTVYYNPLNLQEAVLEPGSAQGTLLSLAVSCIPIIAGIIQLMTGFLKIPRGNQQMSNRVAEQGGCT